MPRKVHSLVNDTKSPRAVQMLHIFHHLSSLVYSTRPPAVNGAVVELAQPAVFPAAMGGSV